MAKLIKMNNIPSAVLHFGTVYQIRALDLLILAWKIVHRHLNQMRNFWGRKKKRIILKFLRNIG
jgi:hypothetical protein